jgi:hypothetical protein
MPRSARTNEVCLFAGLGLSAVGTAISPPCAKEGLLILFKPARIGEDSKYQGMVLEDLCFRCLQARAHTPKHFCFVSKTQTWNPSDSLH